MPRRPRLDLPGIPQHVVQRGNDRQPCFFQEADYLRYPQELNELASALRRSRLCADDESGAPSADASSGGAGCGAHAVARAQGRALYQRPSPPYRNALGVALQGLTCRLQELSVAPLPVCRAQPGACTHGRGAGRLPLVELRRQR